MYFSMLLVVLQISFLSFFSKGTTKSPCSEFGGHDCVETSKLTSLLIPVKNVNSPAVAGTIFLESSSLEKKDEKDSSLVVTYQFSKLPKGTYKVYVGEYGDITSEDGRFCTTDQLASSSKEEKKGCCKGPAESATPPKKEVALTDSKVKRKPKLLGTFSILEEGKNAQGQFSRQQGVKEKGTIFELCQILGRSIMLVDHRGKLLCNGVLGFQNPNNKNDIASAFVENKSL